MSRAKPMVKFMMALEEPKWKRVKREAQKRGIEVQEMIRAVMMGEWFERNPVRAK